MARLFSEELKRRILESSDLVEVVRSYGIELKRAGRNLKACCPFHNEKTPSFNVNAEGQYFKCFGCGKGGDVFSFVMEQERVAFPEALRLLAERAGIPVEEDPRAAARYKQQSDWKSYLYKLNGAALAFYREMLYADEGRQARAYLEQRGITEESWERFQLGYAPGGSLLFQRLQARRAPMKAIIRAGLAGEGEDGSGYVFFRNRLIFPITDTQERVIGFGGRILGEGEPKYLNTPETPLFSKSRTVYGLAQARSAIVERRRAVLVEGYTDVVMCHQHGIANVVAALGTAVTAEHVRILRRWADEVSLLTDSDAAGAGAAERSLAVLFQEDLPARIVRLPGTSTDPCSFLVEHGSSALEEILAKGVSLFEYKLRRVAERYELSTPSGQVRAAGELMALVSLASDPLRRAAYRKEVAARLNLPEGELAIESRRAPRAEAQSAAASASRTVPPPESPVAGAERELLRWIFHQPAWLEAALSDVDFTAFSGGVERLIGRTVLAAVADGKLPPDFERLAQGQAAHSECVAREVLKRLALAENDSDAGGERIEEARQLCVLLAEEAPECQRLKPDELYGMCVRAVRKTRMEAEYAVAKRSVAAARLRGDPAELEAAEERERERRSALRHFQRDSRESLNAAHTARALPNR